MTVLRRTALAVILLSLLLMAISLTALATGEESGTEETTEETTVVTTDIEPAVEVTVPSGDAATADWTYRYLVPTGIVVAVLVVLATTGQYFTNVVRKRYRIVEE